LRRLTNAAYIAVVLQPTGESWLGIQLTSFIWLRQAQRRLSACYHVLSVGGSCSVRCKMSGK